MSIINTDGYDYPDWAAQSNDGPLLVNVEDDIGGGAEYGPFNVAPWYGLNIDMLLGGNAGVNGYIQFQWYADEGETEFFSALEIAACNGGSSWVGLAIPNYGPWLKITAVKTAGATLFLELQLAGMNRIVRPGSNPFGAEGASQYGKTIGAGTTRQLSPTNMVQGNCIVNMTVTQNCTWTFDIATDGGFVSYTLPPLTANTSQSFPWILPITQWGFSVTNPGGADAVANLMILNTPPGG